MALEKDIERRDRDAAKADGWLVYKVQAVGVRGFPDRFYAKDGRIILMEWKRPGGTVDPNQVLRHAELRAAGVEVHVVDSLEQARAIRSCRVPL